MPSDADGWICGSGENFERSIDRHGIGERASTSICDRPDPYPDKDPGSARCYGKSVVPTPSTKEFLRSLVPERAGRCAGTWGCHRGVVVDAQGREEPDEA